LNTTRQKQTLPAKKQRYVRIAIVLAVILGLNLAGTWLGQLVNFQLFPRHDSMMHTLVLVAVVSYILLMAIPFMPGIEIGMAVMLLLGYKSALLIYLCTLIALSISYSVGRFFPIPLVHRFLKWLYLDQASTLICQLEPLNRQQRLALLDSKAPAKLAPFLLNHRYWTIAILLNLPGNALIGGGGGIGLIVGMSGIIPFYKYFLLLVVSILPIPLSIYLQGLGFSIT
jgi:hypothetical protein